jgi:hypothetical protein
MLRGAGASRKVISVRRAAPTRCSGVAINISEIEVGTQEGCCSPIDSAHATVYRAAEPVRTALM